MSGIQKKLDSLQPYVISIRYVQGLQVVDAVFKDGWAVPKSEFIEMEKGSNEEEYYMFFSQKEGIGIDELLDYVEHIIKINVERELKYELLKEKVKELKTLFNKTPLEELKTLKFGLSVEKLIPETMSEEDILIGEAEKYVPTIKEELIIEETPIKDIKNEGPISEVNNQPITQMHNDIELPPRGEKIKLETHDLSKELTEGECNCGPNEACSKCMDRKSL